MALKIGDKVHTVIDILLELDDSRTNVITLGPWRKGIVINIREEPFLGSLERQTVYDVRFNEKLCGDVIKLNFVHTFKNGYGIKKFEHDGGAY